MFVFPSSVFLHGDVVYTKPYSSRRVYLKSQVCRWDFLPLELTDEDLIHCAYLLFEHVLNHPELEALRVPEGKKEKKKEKVT